MHASYVNESNHLRERAIEMRASSKELKDNNTVAVIMRLADLYDRLADRAGKVVPRPDHGNVGNWRQRNRHRCRAHLNATSTAATNPAWAAADAAVGPSYPGFPPGRGGLPTWDAVIAVACALARSGRQHHQRIGAEDGGASGLRARTTL